MMQTRTISVEDNRCNLEELATLSKLAIGGRTLRDYANKSGLSEGFLSRLTTGKLKSAPTRRSLAKLAAENCKPQNGITIVDLMKAAGYSMPEVTKVKKSKVGSVPSEVQTVSFPIYLTTRTLEMTNQFGHHFTSENQREMFFLKAYEKKDIVGIPAFCTPDEIEETIKDVKWRVMMALSIYEGDSSNAFFIILTNQEKLYDEFDKSRVAGTGGEFYITLTEDYKRFIKQRPVKTKNLNGEPEKAKEKKATYDFTRVAE